MNRIMALSIFSLMGCDRSGDDLIPQPNGEFDAVIEIGEMGVMTPIQLGNMASQGSQAKNWCDTTETEFGKRLCYYGIVGQAEVGVKGGATFTFEGTGRDVCIVVDPETVFWNQAVAAVRAERNFRYPDYEEDDGDIDLFAGLSSYYTGSPSLEIGDFKGIYTDSLGNKVEIEYGECVQSSQYTANAHAGRGAAEFCTIDTNNRVGVEYTVVLESFSIPLDDGSLSFGVAVLEGSCSDYTINECLIPGESLVASRDDEGVPKIKDDGELDASSRACSLQLEQAACDGQILQFCCVYPDMCGEDAELQTCSSVTTDQEEFCADAATSKYCCGVDSTDDEVTE